MNNIWLKTKIGLQFNPSMDQNKLPELLTIDASHQISNL